MQALTLKQWFPNLVPPAALIDRKAYDAFPVTPQLNDKKTPPQWRSQPEISGVLWSISPAPQKKFLTFLNDCDVICLHVHVSCLSSPQGSSGLLDYNQFFDVIIKTSDYVIKNLIVMQKIRRLLESLKLWIGYLRRAASTSLEIAIFR